MKQPILFSLLTAALFTQTGLHADTPYYPVGCFHNEDDLNYTVVDVEGGRPIARIDNRLKKVSASNIRFDRMELYADGFIDVLQSELEPLEADMRVVQVRQSGEQIPNRTFLNLKYQSNRDIENCFAVIFSGSTAGIDASNLEELYVSFQDLGRIEAGRTYEGSFGVNIFFSASGQGNKDYFVIFYDAGLPIKSDFEAQIAEHFLERRNKEFQFYLEQYLENNEDKSLKHSPFYTYVPYLPKALYEETGPVDSKVVLRISPDGSVTAESIANLENEAAQAFIKERVSEWRFFPKLDNGNPVPTRIATKVQF